MVSVFLVAIAACASNPSGTPVRAAPSEEVLVAWAEAHQALLEGRADEVAEIIEGLTDAEPIFVPGWRAWQEAQRSAGLGHVAYERTRDLAARRPDDATALYLLGRLLSDSGEQSRTFRRVIAMDPGLSWGHHGLAVVHLREGRVVKAREEYRRACACAPTEPEHALGLASLLLSTGDHGDARALIGAALAGHPRDPRAWSLLARIEAEDGRRVEAMAAARRAVVLGGGSRGYRRAWRDLVLALGSDAAVKAARDEVTALLDRGVRSGHLLLEVGLYALRLGEPREGVVLLDEARDTGVDVTDAVLPWRLALVRLGRHGEAMAVDGLVADEAMRTAPENVLAPRWRALRTAVDVARRSPHAAAASVALGEAMLAVGWLEEAEVVLRAAVVRHPDFDAVGETLGRALAVSDLVRRFAEALEHGYRAEDGGVGGLDGLLEDAEVWMARASLPGSPTDAARQTVPFLGELVDGMRPGRSALHDLLLDHGHVLVLGRRSGGPVEGLLGEAVAVERDRRVVVLGTEVVHDRFVVAHVRVGSSRSVRGGRDLSGAALDGFDILNLDEIRDTAYRTGRQSIPTWRPTDPDDVLCLDWPGGVLSRLALDLPGLPRAVRLDVVSRHEEGHLLDVDRYLPVLSNPLRGVSLVVGAGFSAGEVEGRLEGNAQLVALATAGQPRAALHDLVALGHVRNASPPHSVGYHDALREMVIEIHENRCRYPWLEADRNLLQQLDRLEDAEIRTLARALLARRGIEEG